MYDLFFISYAEPDADERWKRLKERFPHARRMHGITGIANAHKACARQSWTKMFWTVDADTDVDPWWAFDHEVASWDQDYLHVWHARNPINGLIYGYGAIKLWPCDLILKHEKPWLDFTSSLGSMKVIPEAIATTAFNTNPYETWKSAFRECVKLAENVRINPDDLESASRLAGWKRSINGARFAEWAINGASDGESWHARNTENLKLINDFQWLGREFRDRYGG